MENAIKRVAARFRTQKEATESRYERRIPQTHHIIPWMVSNAANSINRFQVGTDGKTSYERWKGKRFTKVIAEFGGCIQGLLLGSVGTEKRATRWIDGIYLGVRDETAEARQTVDEETLAVLCLYFPRAHGCGATAGQARQADPAECRPARARRVAMRRHDSTGSVGRGGSRLRNRLRGRRERPHQAREHGSAGRKGCCSKPANRTVL